MGGRIVFKDVDILEYRALDSLDRERNLASAPTINRDTDPPVARFLLGGNTGPFLVSRPLSFSYTYTFDLSDPVVETRQVISNV